MPVLKIMEFRYAVCRGPVWESDCLGLGNLFYVYFSLNQIILQVRCANFTIRSEWYLLNTLLPRNTRKYTEEKMKTKY